MDVVPLVSIIIPIYNVEKYVRKCLNSLRNQMMGEIEVICIDDGSIDRNERIADEYKSDEFPIFRVIYTENRELNAARNRGIDKAASDWLMFVDSDDWVDSYCAGKQRYKDLITLRYSERKIKSMLTDSGLVLLWTSFK